MKQIVYAAPAEKDLVDIVSYIAADNLNAATKVYDAIRDTIDRLASFPEMGRPGRLDGTREFPVTSLPYLVVYAITTETLNVLAILHMARDLERVLRARQPKGKPRGRGR